MICPGMMNPLGYKILTELPTVGQDTIVSSTSLPLSREVLFRQHQACLESTQTSHETEAWSTHLQPAHLCQHIGALQLPSIPYHECSVTKSLCALIYHGTLGSLSSLYNSVYHIESRWLPSPDQTDLSTTFKAIWLHNWHNMLHCTPLLSC
jgi:hypothetical protein